LVLQAAANQYPALKGLLMRNASGDTSTNLSVGILSPLSVVNSMPDTASTVLASVWASFARSAWLVDAERATEKNRNT
jgi:uncharacterized protein YfaQ (DUF2300 family)